MTDPTDSGAVLDDADAPDPAELVWLREPRLASTLRGALDQAGIDPREVRK